MAKIENHILAGRTHDNVCGDVHTADNNSNIRASKDLIISDSNSSKRNW